MTQCFRNHSVTNKHAVIPYAIVFACFTLILGLLFWCYPPDSSHYTEFRSATWTPFWMSEYPDGPVFVAAKTVSRVVNKNLRLLHGFVFQQSLSMLLPLGIIFLTTFVSYALVLFFSIKITQKLREHGITNPRRKRLHKQINLTLIIQVWHSSF